MNEHTTDTPTDYTDDPRLTAYALGELNDVDRAEFDAACELDPSLAADVAAIRAMADVLTDELGDEADVDGDEPTLATDQRDRVLAEAAAAATATPRRAEPDVAGMAERTPQSPATRARKKAPVIALPNPPLWRRRSFRFAPIAALLAAMVYATIHLVVSSRQSQTVVMGQDPSEPDIGMSSGSRDVFTNLDQPGRHVPGEALQLEVLEMEADDDVVMLEVEAPAAGPPSPKPPRTPQTTPRREVPPPMASPVKPAAGDMPSAAPMRGYERSRQQEQQAPEPQGSESYAKLPENGFETVAASPLSTFSIDVDTASYSNVRRLLTAGQRPPAGAVRVEEMINYFTYDYAPPTDGRPFATHVQVAACPWNTEHLLARVALKGFEVPATERPPANLVFLLDVSGSMSSQNKLPLVQKGMHLLAEAMGPQDRVAIVVYAGASGLVLPSTTGADQAAIHTALDRLQSGGSTNGAAGIQQAYAVAQEHFVKGGINRVILCTDGDFNVGVNSPAALDALITDKAKSGVFLSVLGFGGGNYKDDRLEALADKGNGNYAYIDSEREAYKVLGEQMASTLMTIAKDVKIQVEFNPAAVSHYRLIGYENRVLAKEDFNDDKKDAGEIGAGHTVTALYELVPTGKAVTAAGPAVDELRYQQAPAPQATPPAAAVAPAKELMFVKLRYKLPDADTSTKIEVPVENRVTAFDATDADFRFAAAVAAFGMKLRLSEHLNGLGFAAIQEIAQGATGDDASGYRREFLVLVDKADDLY